MSEEILGMGITGKKNKNGFYVVSLHYSADPEKNEKWANELKPTYLSDIWNQEQELDFTKASGRRVFPEFRTDLHISQLKPSPYKDIWRGWDFGYHHPACVWGQVVNDKLHILAELLGNEIVINKFAEEVIRLSKSLFPGFEFKDAGDPAVRARTDKSERTSADILRALGIRINTKPTLVKDGINLLRNLLLPRIDGFIKFKLNGTCILLTDGFLGGYCRDENTDEPVKDGYYEHLFDALRYLVVNLFNEKTYSEIKPSFPFLRQRKTVDLVAGY